MGSKKDKKTDKKTAVSSIDDVEDVKDNVVETDWQTSIKGYIQYLQLEKSLSKNSIKAYKNDIDKLHEFALLQEPAKSVEQLESTDIEQFLCNLKDLGLIERSQARAVSAIKSFFKYLVLENMVVKNPSTQVDSPKLPQKLPVYLTQTEVNDLLNAIDLSHPQGQRNRAMLETLYACGLRVTELINLQISKLFFDVEIIRVIGKGDRERLVPINQSAMKHINLYLEEVRPHQKIQKGFEDFVFLNRRGKPLTRVMVFTIVKDLTKLVGIKKNISPHTFRHTFATHLYEAGADLRAIQEMLGHRSILTTEIYSHVNTQHLKETLRTCHPRFMVSTESSENASIADIEDLEH